MRVRRLELVVPIYDEGDVMRITYEPDNEAEKGLEKVVVEHVYEFAIVGSSMKNEVVPVPFSHVHGRDIPHMIGQLAEMKERLRITPNGS